MQTEAKTLFQERIEQLTNQFNSFISQKNKAKKEAGNGIYQRYVNPIVTAHHAPLEWRFDFNPDTNPYAMERIGINATFNAGAIKWNEKYILAVRVEGNDRKSFFAIAESATGVDNFTFWKKPVVIPQIENNPDTNVYDMRLVSHEDGWVYGIF